jgi:hypothetical protein
VTHEQERLSHTSHHTYSFSNRLSAGNEADQNVLAVRVGMPAPILLAEKRVSTAEF